MQEHEHNMRNRYRKKTKCFFSFLLFFFVMSAQAVWGQQKFEIAVGGYYQHHSTKDNLYGFQVTGAYRLTPHWRLGITSGIGTVDWYFKPSDKGMKGHQQFLPVSAQVKYNLLDKRFSPYFGMEAGYCFSLSKGDENLGMTYKPLVGLDVSLNNHLKCYCQLGYNFQTLTRNIYQDGTSIRVGGGSTIGYGGPSVFKDKYSGELIEFALGLTVVL